MMIMMIMIMIMMIIMMMMMVMMMMLAPVDPCIIGKKAMDVFWGGQARDSAGSQEASFSIQQIYEDECDVAVDCAVRNVLERLGWQQIQLGWNCWFCVMLKSGFRDLLVAILEEIMRY